MSKGKWDGANTTNIPCKREDYLTNTKSGLEEGVVAMKVAARSIKVGLVDGALT